MKPMTEAFISDIHFGTYDQDLVAWELCLETLRVDPVDLIFLGGDVFDFLNMSRYLKDPTYNITFQEEIDAGEFQLERLRKVAPNSRIWLLPGNHDTPRLQRAIWSKMPELAGLRALRYENLIDFKGLEIECFPEGQPVKIGHLWHIHGHEVLRNARVNPAKAVLDVMQGNTIFGHVHKFTTYQNWDVNGFQYAAWSNGCLASLTPHYTLKPDWCQGYTRIHYTPGGYFNVVPLQFFHNPDDPQHRGVVMNGTMYRTETIEGIGKIVEESQPSPWKRYSTWDVVSGPRVHQRARFTGVGGTQWADASKMPYAHEEPDTKPDIPQVTNWDEGDGFPPPPPPEVATWHPSGHPFRFEVEEVEGVEINTPDGTVPMTGGFTVETYTPEGMDEAMEQMAGMWDLDREVTHQMGVAAMKAMDKKAALYQPDHPWHAYRDQLEPGLALDWAIMSIMQPADARMWNGQIRSAMDELWKERYQTDYCPYGIITINNRLEQLGFIRCKSGSLRGMKGILVLDKYLKEG